MTNTNNPLNATSIASWSIALAKTLRLYDHNAEEVFSSAGIDLSSINSPSERLPVDSVQLVWKFASENTDDCFGARAASFLGPSSFHSLGFSLLCSGSIREIFERLIRYRSVISNLFFAEIIERDEGYWFTTVDERKVKTNITHDTMFAYILQIIRMTHTPDYQPVAIRLNRKRETQAGQLEQLMRAPINFDCSESGILFPKQDFDQHLVNGNPSLAQKQDKLTEQYIGEHQLISEYMLRVKSEIAQQLRQGEVNINQVAENIHVTVRTLQRRLSDESSSYHDLLDKVRHEWTMDLVTEPGINATEIAFQLGFSDSSSFSRNFKRWTGQSFNDYKQKKKNR